MSAHSFEDFPNQEPILVVPVSAELEVTPDQQFDQAASSAFLYDVNGRTLLHPEAVEDVTGYVRPPAKCPETYEAFENFTDDDKLYYNLFYSFGEKLNPKTGRVERIEDELEAVQKIWALMNSLTKVLEKMVTGAEINDKHTNGVGNALSSIARRLRDGRVKPTETE